MHAICSEGLRSTPTPQLHMPCAVAAAFERNLPRLFFLRFPNFETREAFCRWRSEGLSPSVRGEGKCHGIFRWAPSAACAIFCGFCLVAQAVHTKLSWTDSGLSCPSWGLMLLCRSCHSALAGSMACRSACRPVGVLLPLPPLLLFTLRPVAKQSKRAQQACRCGLAATLRRLRAEVTM